MARAVVPSFPHHIIQRGNRRQRTFFGAEDYRFYIALLAEWCQRCAVEVWAYCLMPNHVHLVAVPQSADGLRRAIGEVHRRYTLQVNNRQGWQGHLWQGRFASYVMDDRYVLAAARYIELNPVRAGLVGRAEDYPWSSARAHLLGRDDRVVTVAPLLANASDWASFLDQAGQPGDVKEFRKHEGTGRPLGSDSFVREVEKLLGRRLKKQKPGPRRRNVSTAKQSPGGPVAQAN